MSPARRVWVGGGCGGCAWGPCLPLSSTALCRRLPTCGCRLLPLYDLVQGRTFTAKNQPRSGDVTYRGQYWNCVVDADLPSTHYHIGAEQLVNCECSLIVVGDA